MKRTCGSEAVGNVHVKNIQVINNYDCTGNPHGRHPHRPDITVLPQHVSLSVVWAGRLWVFGCALCERRHGQCLLHLHPQSPALGQAHTVAGNPWERALTWQIFPIAFRFVLGKKNWGEVPLLIPWLILFPLVRMCIKIKAKIFYKKYLHSRNISCRTSHRILLLTVIESRSCWGTWEIFSLIWCLPVSERPSHPEQTRLILCS